MNRHRRSCALFALVLVAGHALLGCKADPVQLSQERWKQAGHFRVVNLTDQTVGVMLGDDALGEFIGGSCTEFKRKSAKAYEVQIVTPGEGVRVLAKGTFKVTMGGTTSVYVMPSGDGVALETVVGDPRDCAQGSLMRAANYSSQSGLKFVVSSNGLNTTLAEDLASRQPGEPTAVGAGECEFKVMKGSQVLATASESVKDRQTFSVIARDGPKGKGVTLVVLLNNRKAPAMGGGTS